MLPESIEELVDNFSLLDDWEERYRYVIDLGKMLPNFPTDKQTENYRVRGCASNVWVIPSYDADSERFHFQMDSDAFIVKGLLAILYVLYNNKTANNISQINVFEILSAMNLKENITQQRANGLSAVVDKIKSFVEACQQARCSG